MIRLLESFLPPIIFVGVCYIFICSSVMVMNPKYRQWRRDSDHS
jgi:hypothetical protein